MWCASVAAAMQAKGGSAASGGSTGGSVAAAGIQNTSGEDGSGIGPH